MRVLMNVYVKNYKLQINKYIVSSSYVGKNHRETIKQRAINPEILIL